MAEIKHATGYSGTTHWMTEDGWQDIDPATEVGLLCKMLYAAWDEIYALRQEIKEFRRG